MTAPNIHIAQEDDVFGEALKAYFNGDTSATLTVESNEVETDEWPVSEFFHTWDTMSPIERRALTLAKGRTLDVGAGSGSHTLWLLEHGVGAEALDISDGACHVLLHRGIKIVYLSDFLHFPHAEGYDTVLILMNGTGLAGTLDGLDPFLLKAKELLNPGGQVLIDSSDLIYLFEEEDGSIALPIGGKYYGEITYAYTFNGMRSKPFKWLFVDQQTLADAADRCGLNFELVLEGDHYDYLARLTSKND